MAEHKDWRKCQDHVAAFKKCIEESRRKPASWQLLKHLTWIILNTLSINLLKSYDPILFCQKQVELVILYVDYRCGQKSSSFLKYKHYSSKQNQGS